MMVEDRSHCGGGAAAEGAKGSDGLPRRMTTTTTTRIRPLLQNLLIAWMAFTIGICFLTWSRYHNAVVSQWESITTYSDVPVLSDDSSFLRRYQPNSNLIAASVAFSSSPTTTSMPKILLFITTIFSSSHMKYFSCCWPQLMHHSKLLPHVHVMVFTNNSTTIPQEDLDLVESIFHNNPSYHVRYAPLQDVEYIQKQHHHNMFQLGANLGPKLAFANGWFDEYDWVIRINPDVLIRNSTWILEQMMMMATINEKTKQEPKEPSSSTTSTAVEGIFVNCSGEVYQSNKKQLHTDFFAVQPKALMKYHTPNSNNNSAIFDIPFSHMELETWSAPMVKNEKYFLNHEATAYKYFLPLLQAGTYRYLPDADNSKGTCRVRGIQASVHHGHGSCRDDKPNVCDALVNWKIT